MSGRVTKRTPSGGSLVPEACPASIAQTRRRMHDLALRLDDISA